MNTINTEKSNFIEHLFDVINLRVTYREGECSSGHIVWSHWRRGFLTVEWDDFYKIHMLNIRGARGHGYAFYDHETRLFFRYEGSEHCLQINQYEGSRAYF